MVDTRDASILDLIYEAAVVPEMWGGLLGRLAVQATGEHGIVFSSSATSTKFIASSAVYHKDAVEHFAQQRENPRTQRLLNANRAGFLADSDAFTPQERETLPIFRDFFIPRGYGHGAATAIPMPTGEMVVIHVEGRYRPEPFSPVALSWLDSIRPHLARSALLSARLEFERTRTAVETLAGLGLAACAVRPSGSVILANRQFEEERAIWTTRGGERIGLLDKRADDLLAASIRQIGSEGAVRSIPLRPTEETGPAILHVVPVRRAALDLFAHAAAILVLTRTSAAPTLKTPLLQALFDLSPTEAAIAARIAAGRTIAEVAVSDGKSPETVRTQLKNVLAKTGCARQADLSRLLAQLMPTS